MPYGLLLHGESREKKTINADLEFMKSQAYIKDNKLWKNPRTSTYLLTSDITVIK